MKIVHYSFGVSPVRTGGTPRYVLDLCQTQAELGHEVILLLPGFFDRCKKNETKIKRWKNKNGVTYWRIVNPNYVANAFGVSEPLQFMRPMSRDIYLNWLEDLKPDIIHIHSILGLHLEFLQAANQKNIPLVYTVHDFYGICPKIDLLKSRQKCLEKDWQKCVECCKDAYSLRRLRLEQTELYRLCCNSSVLMKISMNRGIMKLKPKLFRLKHRAYGEGLEINKRISEFKRLREYYLEIYSCIDYYHYNSRQTREVLELRIGEKKGTVLPVMHRGIKDNRTRKEFEGVLKIGYLGSQLYYKGFDFLISELDKLYATGRAGFQLNTYIDADVIERKYLKNHGTFSYAEQTRIFNQMDLLIVPSVWWETFGFVVMEALSYGVPVLVSENVGAAMLIEDFPHIGKIFPLEIGALKEILEKIYDNRNLLKEMNESIIQVNINFDYINHVNQIIQIYQNVSEEKYYEDNVKSNG